MELIRDVEKLRHLAELHQERSRLLILARGAIVWGIINVLIGILCLPESILNIVLFLIGMFLLIEGVWFSIRPSAIGVIVDAVAFLLIGTWNISIVALEMLLGEQPSFPIFWAILGFVCIGIAFYRMMTFPRLLLLFQAPIADEDLQHMDDLIRYLSKTPPKAASDIIALQTGSVIQQRQWRVLLGPHYALFFDVMGKKIVVADCADVLIEERGKVLIGSTLKVRIHIRDKRWNGLISPASFAKFQAWKWSAVPETATEPQPQAQTDAITRRDQIQ